VHFHAKHDAEALHKAFKGFGCDKARVTEILTSRSNSQRQEIAHEYKREYGKDLRKELKSELSGDFEDLALGLMEPPMHFLANEMRKAMKGAGTRENVLIEILVTLNNAEIHELKHAYQHLHDRNLEKDVISETSGDFQRILVSLLSGARDDSHHKDPHKAHEDARLLYRSGEQIRGTDESVFNKIFATQNHDQLRLVFDEYQRVTGHSIEQAIEGEFSGDIKDALMAIVKVIRSKTIFLTEQVYKSMEGLGTRDTDLIRLIVSRSEIDLADIKVEYQCLYGKPLEKAIADDCSGAYKDGLIAIVNGN
jgi:annexin A7/11